MNSALPESFDERLISWLVAHGKAADGLLRQTRALPEARREDFSRLVARLGLVSERDLADGLSELTGAAPMREADYPDLPLFENELPVKFLRAAGVLPVAERDGTVVVACACPQDDYTARALALALDRPIDLRTATGAEIARQIDRLYGGKDVAPEPVDPGAGPTAEEIDDIDALRDRASEAPVVRLVNHLITRAVELDASDVHLEPFEHRLRVRYRIDGVLREIDAPAARMAAGVVSRVKLLARLNIAERRLPQDGRMMLRVQGRDVDLRVSTVPTLHGESVVLRLLDRETVELDFDALGFDPAVRARFEAAICLPHGIVLVTGPTGSGKTTTLYTALRQLNTLERKILTVEDPIEYQLEGVNQIQVKPQIGLTFANALRHIMRQDPDAIMVGEMRDLETARIAVQSALTGHLVLSTLHTNDAGGSITRLLDMGVEDYLITSTVNGVLAQRLVRRLCPQCREPYEAGADQVAHLAEHAAAHAGPVRLYRGRGCAACAHGGYRGRLAIVEFMPMSESLRALILRRADAGALQAQAIAEGMRTLEQDGLAKALAGATSMDEVLRVTQDAG
ncbi:MAG: type II secretion system ATPase GspE [Gammaproteobacteria bacterium]